jgi:glucose-6-phosphate-specific signal transduction histidine kinase
LRHRVPDDRRQDGVGIAGMRERLQELGGHLDVRAVGRGMAVVACLPREVRASA